MTVKEGTYKVMWFCDQNNPKSGLSTRLFDSALDVKSFVQSSIKGDHLILKCASASESKNDWIIIELNYSKKNIWKIFKK